MPTEFEIRQAVESDIPAISVMLQKLTDADLRSLPSDEEFVRERYVLSPVRLSCAVVADEERIHGLQILNLAKAGNPYETPLGWGTIGTHVDPTSHRRGFGRTLFEVTRQAGTDAGLRYIEATIGDTNDSGLSYYASLGFRRYTTAPGVVRTRYDYSSSFRSSPRVPHSDHRPR